MKRAMDLSLRTYRWLLRLYPSTHLAEYGEEMARCFADLCRDGARRRGLAGVVGAWGFVVRDLVGSLIREHWTEGRHIMTWLSQVLCRKINDRLLMGAARSFLSIGAVLLLLLAVFKLLSLPLTEGELLIGLLAAFAVSLQMMILVVLATPARVAPSEKQ